MESLKLALSMFESRFEVYYAAAADAPGPGAVVEAGLLFVVADIVPPVFAIIVSNYTYIYFFNY